MCKMCTKKYYMEDSMTSHVVEFDNCVILIRNVPCRECERCGEIYYTTEVMRNLERIVSEAKQVIQEVSIINYSTAA